MYLTGTSIRNSSVGEGQLSGTFLRKKTEVSIFFDYRLAATNEKYSQLMRVTTANLIISYYNVLW